jgi:hypothetical protein
MREIGLLRGGLSSMIAPDRGEAGIGKPRDRHLSPNFIILGGEVPADLPLALALICLLGLTEVTLQLKATN